MTSLDQLDFLTLQQIAKDNNLKHGFKTKQLLINHLVKSGIGAAIEDEASMNDDDWVAPIEYVVTPAADPSARDLMEWDESFAPDKVRVHTHALKDEDLKALKETLKKLGSTNKLTELERVQKFVFNQLGII